jgi:hypothetical protein
VIESNGNTTLNASTGTANTVTTSRVTEVRLYNANQGINAGQPVDASQSYYLIDAAGNEISGTRVAVGDKDVPDAATAQANFEELVDGDGVGDVDFTANAFKSARTTTDLPSNGGNLIVKGQTTTKGIDNTGNKVTGVAAGTADTDAVNKGQLDTASTALQQNIDTEAQTRGAADTALQQNIDTEAQTRGAADTALQQNINTEAQTRGDADTAETKARGDADTALQKNIDTEAQTRASLITTAGTNADGNQIVHIGDNSLVTQELGGMQLLSAQDGLANPIDINVTNGSDLLVNGVSVATDADVSDEAKARGKADDALQSNITAEAKTRGAADETLQGNINTEAATRAFEDTAIRNEFRLADTNIVKDYTSKIDAETDARIMADDQIRGEFRAADNAIRDEFRSADQALKRDIDMNTRGIAMVAAMTNTTVESGKTHGVDFNVAQFESSTGFSFGYANRLTESVQLHAAVASSQDFEEAVGRIGVSIQW